MAAVKTTLQPATPRSQLNKVYAKQVKNVLNLTVSGRGSQKAHGVGRVVGALGSEAGFAGSMLN